MFIKRKFKKQSVVNIVPRDLRISSFPAPSAMDNFICQKQVTPYDDKESIRMTSDIYMLFNQQRLDRMSRENLVEYFNNMAVRDSSFSSLKKRLTDDQLISVVKSRYIQQASELFAWSKYLNSLGDEQLRAVVAPASSVDEPAASVSAAASSSSDSSNA